MTKSQEISRQILEKMHSVASVNGINLTSASVVRAGLDHVLGRGNL